MRDPFSNEPDFAPPSSPAAARVWGVGALCRAVVDALDARFNPVTVRGEITGWSRASSGHCYFSLKDASGQIRCAMFRRAASLLNFNPRDGELVEVRGRLGVYEQRGDLQLVAESMKKAGQGALFEQFVQLKAQLESEGLFAQERKRPLPLMPRAIGVVTSLGAAALHDVVSALQRRVPHIPVVIAPAAVQGAAAPEQLRNALLNLYQTITISRRHWAEKPQNLPENDLVGHINSPPIDVILLVRGGGSMEDLWAFNDEQLARLIVQSPVPIVSGVGHETDFSIADFCADLRAPTPTAAAELCSAEQATWLGALGLMQERLSDALHDQLDAQSQRLDQAAQRLGRPSGAVAKQRMHLEQLAGRLRYAALTKCEQEKTILRRHSINFPQKIALTLAQHRQRLERSGKSLELLDPQHVLKRGYAMLTTQAGQVVSASAQVQAGQRLRAGLADGVLDLMVN
jgi:exodeoxyribonuclease VII large subunit